MSRIPSAESKVSLSWGLRLALGVLGFSGLWMKWLFFPGVFPSQSPGAGWILHAQNQAGYFLLGIAPLVALVFLGYELWGSLRNKSFSRWVKRALFLIAVGLAVHLAVCLVSSVLAPTRVGNLVFGGRGKQGGDVAMLGPVFDMLLWPFYAAVLALPFSVILLAGVIVLFRRRFRPPVSLAGAPNLALAATLVVVLPLWALTGGYKGANARDYNGRTALMEAAERGDLTAAQALIRAGADVKAKEFFAVWDEEAKAHTRKSRTALQLAAYGGHTEVVRTLMAAGADASERDLFLLAAAHQCNADLVLLLLQAQADVNVRDARRRTPLILAAAAGRLGSQSQAAVVQSLIKAGADVNAQDKEGRTALMEATYRASTVWPTSRIDLEIVRMLLEAGADRSLKDNSGETALTQRWYSYAPELEQLLREGVLPLAVGNTLPTPASTPSTPTPRR